MIFENSYTHNFTKLISDQDIAKSIEFIQNINTPDGENC